MLKTNCCWNRWQFKHDKKHEVVHCTSNWLPIFRQSWSFTGFHSNEYPCFEQSIGSNRTAGVSSSNRIVTNRSKSWTKTCACSFTCTVSVAVSTDKESLDLLREVSLLSEHKTLLLSIVHFFRTNSTLLCCHNLLVTRFPQVFIPQNRAAKDFAHEVRLFGIMPPNCPFLSRILVSYQMHPENFWCVPPKRSIPIPHLSVEQNSLDLSLEKHNLGPLFFLSQQQLCLEYLLFSTPRWGYFSSACRKKATNATNAPVSQTCNHDTRDDADNYMTIFFILSTIDKEFF